MEKEKRKEREFNLRKTEILEEAAKIFAAKGFFSATVAEIANASGFAIGTLYQFFESKEKLYAEVLTEKLGTMYAGIREAVEEEQEPLRKIEVLVAAQFRFVEENREFCSIFIRGDYLSLSEGSGDLRGQMIKDYSLYASFVEGVMQKGIRAGVLKNLAPGLMADALLGVINSYAAKWLVAAEGASLMVKVQPVVDIFLGGVRKNAH